MAEPDLIAVRAVAAYLGITLTVLYALARKGRLGPVVIGKAQRGRPPMLLQRRCIEAFARKRLAP